MERITVTLPEDMADRIDELEGDSGEYESKSEAVRELIRQGERLEEVERERDRLERQLGQVIEQREQNQELVRYVEDELSYREASLVRRAKWWVFGKA